MTVSALRLLAKLLKPMANAYPNLLIRAIDKINNTKNETNVPIAQNMLPEMEFTFILATIAKDKNESIKKNNVKPCKLLDPLGKAAATSVSNAASYASSLVIIFCETGPIFLAEDINELAKSCCCWTKSYTIFKFGETSDKLLVLVFIISYRVTIVGLVNPCIKGDR